jgi:hypothetical protein
MNSKNEFFAKDLESIGKINLICAESYMTAGGQLHIKIINETKYRPLDYNIHPYEIAVFSEKGELVHSEKLGSDQEEIVITMPYSSEDGAYNISIIHKGTTLVDCKVIVGKKTYIERYALLECAVQDQAVTLKMIEEKKYIDAYYKILSSISKYQQCKEHAIAAETAIEYFKIFHEMGYPIYSQNILKKAIESYEYVDDQDALDEANYFMKKYFQSEMTTELLPKGMINIFDKISEIKLKGNPALSRNKVFKYSKKESNTSYLETQNILKEALMILSNIESWASNDIEKRKAIYEETESAMRFIEESIKILEKDKESPKELFRFISSHPDFMMDIIKLFSAIGSSQKLVE